MLRILWRCWSGWMTVSVAPGIQPWSTIIIILWSVPNDGVADKKEQRECITNYFIVSFLCVISVAFLHQPAYSHRKKRSKMGPRSFRNRALVEELHMNLLPEDVLTDKSVFQGSRTDRAKNQIEVVCGWRATDISHIPLIEGRSNFYLSAFNPIFQFPLWNNTNMMSNWVINLVPFDDVSERSLFPKA